jgi:hypothetical protein
LGSFSRRDVKKFNDAKTAVSSRLGCSFPFGAGVLRRSAQYIAILDFVCL